MVWTMGIENLESGIGRLFNYFIYFIYIYIYILVERARAQASVICHFVPCHLFKFLVIFYIVRVSSLCHEHSVSLFFFFVCFLCVCVLLFPFFQFLDTMRTEYSTY